MAAVQTRGDGTLTGMAKWRKRKVDPPFGWTQVSQQQRNGKTVTLWRCGKLEKDIHGNWRRCAYVCRKDRTHNLPPACLRPQEAKSWNDPVSTVCMWRLAVKFPYPLLSVIFQELVHTTLFLLDSTFCPENAPMSSDLTITCIHAVLSVLFLRAP